jgi:hypothetical protein
MNATLIEYNESGKTLSRKKLWVNFASSERCPSIEISLPDKQFRHRSIIIPAKLLLRLIMDRLFDTALRK